jgi:hypothetical protein
MTINSDNCTKKSQASSIGHLKRGGFWMHLVKVESLFLSEFQAKRVSISKLQKK